MWARLWGHVRQIKLRQQRAYSYIEPKVKPLVERMNATGIIRTVASCQGHLYGKPPYVYFKAPTDVAASIERRLRKIATLDDPGLKTDWTIYGLFDADYKLTFFLHSPEYHRRSNSLLGAMWFFWFNRKCLDAELLSLASIVEQAVLLNIRDVHEPNSLLSHQK